MSWSVVHDGSALRVEISAPVGDGWESLLDEVQASLSPHPKAAYVPSRIQGAANRDVEMLKVLWQSLADLGIPILAPR